MSPRVSRLSFSAVACLRLLGREFSGLLEEAGFSEEEIDALMAKIDRIIGEEWALRNTG
jgi:hypothetical protein